MHVRPMITAMVAVLFSVPGSAEDLVQPAAEVGAATIPTGETVTYTFKPDGSGPFPTILYLQGYPCRTAAPEDERNSARKRMITAFVEAGHLVHIAEKPGLGGGQSSAACKDLTYSEEVAAFDQVLDQLQQRPDVDSENLYIFGHSMGGQTAPLIARNHKVKGIITYGIHAKPWFEFMIDITRAQAERIGIDPAVADEETQAIIPFLYDLMILKRDWDYLSTTHSEALATGVFRADGEYLNGRHYTFWADLNDADFAKAWSGYDGRVLAMYGEYDIASISDEGAQRIADIVNFSNTGRAQVQVVPRTGHGFATIDGTFEDYLAQRFGVDWSGSVEASMFNQDVADRMIGWIEGQ
ncbi:MAG: alpha/beta fold hydrolase [Pseudomonadota bacterium]